MLTSSGNIPVVRGVSIEESKAKRENYAVVLKIKYANSRKILC